MLSFFRKKNEIPKSRKSLSAGIYGLENSYIYCSSGYSAIGLNHNCAPFGQVKISDGYVEKLGQCILSALEQSGHYDANFDQNRPFIFAGLSKHKGFQALDHQSIGLAIYEQVDGTLQVSAYDSTHRRAKIRTLPKPKYIVPERTALSIGQTIIEAERPYREIMMATKWKKTGLKVR